MEYLRVRQVAAGFRIAISASALFFVLTIAAMLLYPGGRVGDHESLGYSFFTNFFSDLGQTRTYGGHANYPSLVLFCIALGATGIAAAVFFLTFSRLFEPRSAARRWGGAGGIFGIFAGLCFIGVAATPWNLYLQAHNQFVLWAFRLFLLAAICSGTAAVLGPRTRACAYVFASFSALLIAYITLLTIGPPAGTATGAAVQATAQKIIVYASVLTILVVSLLALKFARLRVVAVPKS